MAVPTAPGSNFVSPVDFDTQDADNKLTHVGARTNGLPTGTDGIDSLITKAYDLAARKPFRRQLVFGTMATARATALSHNGAVIQLNVVDDLDDDPDTAALVEDYDVLPTPLKSYASNIILEEWGRTVTKTALARGTSMIPLDPVAAERVGRNMGATVERIAYNAALAAGGIKKDGTAGGAPNDVTVAGGASDTLRAASEYFRSNNVDTMDDGFYKAVLSPAAETALRKEADAAGWRYWQINQEEMGGTGSIMSGKLGVYEGFSIYTSTLVGNEGGVYLGNEGLAVGNSSAPGFGAPQVVVAPVVDRLRRFASVGWFWLGNYARFRAEAICVGNPAATTP